MDIGKVLNGAWHVRVRSLDDININLVTQDIHLYVFTQLRELDG